MSTEEVKDVFRHDLAELWNKGNLALADEIFTADVVLHGAPPELPPGVEGVKQVISMYRAAFPDFYVTDEDVIAEGDKIVSRWSWIGTQKGELFGIPPTGQQVTVTGITINRFADGKIAEVWSAADQLGMMQQLGVIPSEG
jgi:steroid delta-isomerase-like uncharacterized protein